MQELSQAQSTIISSEPLMLEGATAKLAGEGGLILVRYRYNRPVRGMRTSAWILDDASGRQLNVQMIPLIGPLNSYSLSRRPTLEGYFVADNGERIVKAGSKITVVVGELRKENVIVA